MKELCLIVVILCYGFVSGFPQDTNSNTITADVNINKIDSELGKRYRNINDSDVNHYSFGSEDHSSSSELIGNKTNYDGPVSADNTNADANKTTSGVESSLEVTSIESNKTSAGEVNKTENGVVSPDVIGNRLNKTSAEVVEGNKTSIGVSVSAEIVSSEINENSQGQSSGELVSDIHKQPSFNVPSIGTNIFKPQPESNGGFGLNILGTAGGFLDSAKGIAANAAGTIAGTAIRAASTAQGTAINARDTATGAIDSAKNFAGQAIGTVTGMTVNATRTAGQLTSRAFNSAADGAKSLASSTLGLFSFGQRPEEKKDDVTIFL